MPFTLAHPAAVLPLTAQRLVPLPVAALVAGSMAPDVPYFIPPLAAVPWSTHTLVTAVTYDVLLGLALWLVWRAVAGGLHLISPRPVRERWSPVSWRDAPAWSVGLALAVGSLTHVLWDEFTHPGRFGTAVFPVLAASHPSPIGPLEGFRYAQYLSGVVGLAVIAWWVLRTPRRPVERTPVPQHARLFPVLVTAGAVAGAVLRIWLASGGELSLRPAVFHGITGGIAGGTAVLVLMSLAAARSARRLSR